MDPLHTDIFYQYQADCFLNSIMHLFFFDPEPPTISILYGMEDLGCEATLNYALLYFH